jgi:hypothetical protein
MDQRTRILAGTVQSTPSFVMRLTGVSGLISEAADCWVSFQRIMDLYPTSLVATVPFSKKWRPTADCPYPLDGSVRDGLAWAITLERHVEHYRNFKEDIWPSLTVAGETRKLLLAVPTWKDEEISGGACILLLKAHLDALKEVRRNHAASLAEPTYSFMMSQVDHT